MTKAETDMRNELDKLKSDLVNVKDDLRSLSSSAVSEGRDAARALKDNATAQVNEGVDTARHCVQEHPLTTTAIAAGVGLLAGMLLFRR